MRTLALSGTMALCAALPAILALAQNPSEGTEGWNYGGLHCGCVANKKRTVISCQDCCNVSAQDGRLPAWERDNCFAFCNQSGGDRPCNARPGGFFDVLSRPIEVFF